MRMAGACSAALAASGLSRVAAGAGRSDRPNVLFIAFDDMNDWVGCLGGHPNAKTPNIDRLARESLLFTNAHCAAPLCGPSRFSTMFSVRPSTSGIYGNSVGAIERSAEKRTSIHQALHENGYHTALLGKIYHGRIPGSALKHIDVLGDAFGGKKTYSVGPHPDRDVFTPAERKPLGKYFNYQAMDVDDEKFGDVLVRKWAVKQLQKDYDKPFFLSVGFFRPHAPWTAPKRFFDRFDKDKLTMPTIKKYDLEDLPAAAMQMIQGQPGDKYQTVTKNGLNRDFVHAYLACQAFADDQLGHLMAALKKSKHADNTIVVVWSDHGFHLGEKMRFTKNSPWEESSRTVLMVKAPGATKGGTKCDQPVSLMDMYPTICELTGTKLPAKLGGESLVSLLKDPTRTTGRAVVTTVGAGNHSVRSTRWRYIRYADGGEELYDHDADPNEWRNLAGNDAYADVKMKMKAHLPKKNTYRSR